MKNLTEGHQGQQNARLTCGGTAPSRSLRSIVNASDISPLRYPGGKRRLVLPVLRLFLLAQRPIKLLVEPFAGGASVSIAMLEAGIAETVALSEKDQMVAAFWQTVFSNKAERLARTVETATVTLAERDRLVSDDSRSLIHLAYKCLFINRTSFSGIINQRAGVIGGRTQNSKYKIDCRFNRTKLAARIRVLSRFRDRVRFVRHQAYERTIEDIESEVKKGLEPSTIFWYLDPPFFEKANRLYRHFFDEEGHQNLRKAIELLPGNFVLSYDMVAEAQRLYLNDPRCQLVTVLYSASSKTSRSTQELLISNIPFNKQTSQAHNKYESPSAGENIAKRYCVSTR